MDDTFIHLTAEEHMDDLMDLFKVLRKYGLKLSPHECQFFKKTIVYMGLEFQIQGDKVCYENRAKRFRNEEIFQDNQMVYLLAPHDSALQTNTTKFKQDFIGPLFIDTTLEKMHYRLKDVTGLLLDSMYHMSHIKKGSACTPLGIVDKSDTYETALKNTLLNKFTIKTPNNKLQEVTLQDSSKELDYLPDTIMDFAPMHG